jgi:hypothetical protein
VHHLRVLALEEQAGNEGVAQAEESEAHRRARTAACTRSSSGVVVRRSAFVRGKRARPDRSSQGFAVFPRSGAAPSAVIAGLWRATMDRLALFFGFDMTDGAGGND